MPKYKPETARMKAQKVSKDFIKAGLNGSEVARRRGTTPQNENAKRRRKPVQDCLQEFLNSDKLKKALIEKGVLGLEIKKTIGATILVDKDGKVIKAENEGMITVDDNNVQHRYWRDLMQAAGALKNNGEGGKQVVQVFVGAEMVTAIKELEKEQTESKGKEE